ncbi:unnamed protein product, partial [Didymodactylos carnosus]
MPRSFGIGSCLSSLYCSDRGNCYFYAGVSANTSMSQIIDLTSYSSAIDNNMMTYNLSAWLGGITSQDDSASVSFTFLDTCYGLLGTSGTIGPVKALDRSSQTELLYRSTSGSVLPNTRYVNIQVVITRFSGSTSNGDVDDISL